MGQATHDQVTLMLQLYDLRREPKLRQAREWFTANFHANTPEEMMKVAPPGSEENAFFRMTVSYWDMVAAIANRGLLDEDLFFETNGEIWLVWERTKGVAPGFRQMLKNPHAWENLEECVRRLDAWRERRAPGTTQAMRELMERMMAAQPAKK